MICLLPEQQQVDDSEAHSAWAATDVVLLPGSRVQAMYGCETARERFRHRYELNNEYKAAFEQCGVVFCGMTPDKRIMQILDYPAHPFFVATQYHPELLSRPQRPHPLFLAFVQAAKKHQNQS